MHTILKDPSKIEKNNVNSYEQKSNENVISLKKGFQSTFMSTLKKNIVDPYTLQ